MIPITAGRGGRPAQLGSAAARRSASAAPVRRQVPGGDQAGVAVDQPGGGVGAVAGERQGDAGGDRLADEVRRQQADRLDQAPRAMRGEHGRRLPIPRDRPQAPGRVRRPDRMTGIGGRRGRERERWPGPLAFAEAAELLRPEARHRLPCLRRIDAPSRAVSGAASLLIHLALLGPLLLVASKLVRTPPAPVEPAMTMLFESAPPSAPALAAPARRPAGATAAARRPATNGRAAPAAGSRPWWPIPPPPAPVGEPPPPPASPVPTAPPPLAAPLPVPVAPAIPLPPPVVEPPPVPRVEPAAPPRPSGRGPRRAALRRTRPRGARRRVPPQARTPHPLRNRPARSPRPVRPSRPR